ncbi:MAG: ferredoxin [Acidaminococcus sp.]|jgi:ferredoxin|nr:ferredoxin [Acidaminococcus sp.]MCI2100022.1 ferredoxin [Acidaminococcus sp.]MCI2114298.1 ferredoxin [Acidaminococcus sp.]MCI2116907.1 ferredoxin [Acidaminococcus sp.]
MKYHVNESCIGCTLCTGTCPAVFSMGPDGKAVAAETVPAGEEAAAQEAMEGCPVGAIEKAEE